MKVTIEHNGRMHVLRMRQGALKNICTKCSLSNVCSLPRSALADIVMQVCDAGYGFREMKKNECKG